ncbi:hypothetical protein [Actinotalea sp.]
MSTTTSTTAADGVTDALEAARWPMVGDDKGHASLRSLLGDGYQILTS